MRSFWFSCLVALWAPVAAVGSLEFWQHEWPHIDFSQTTVQNWAEVLSGGPSKDGIPSYGDTHFLIAFSNNRITDRE